MGCVARRDVARGEKTAEDQGVPWTKTRVCDLAGAVSVLEEDSRTYLIFQLSWTNVDGREIALGLVSDIVRSLCRCVNNFCKFFCLKLKKDDCIEFGSLNCILLGCCRFI